MHGQGNLGDDAMFEAACRLLVGRRLMEMGMPRQEAVLRSLGLGGPRYFSSVILGGGTLVNTWAASWVRAALDQGLPLWTLGTGVGSCGFAEENCIPLDSWRPLLPRFVKVGVRGPRSRQALLDLGVSNVEVVGDLALALTPSEPATPLSRPTVAVNVTLPPPNAGGPDQETYVESAARAVEPLRQKGWDVLLVAMHRLDRQALRELAGRLGIPPQIARPRTAREFFDLVGGCAMTLAVRLHAAVLSCCAGVPPILVGYRGKCLDFMESMGLESWHVPEDGRLAERLPAKALELADAASGLRGEVHRRALEWQGRLSGYVRAAVEAGEKHQR